MFPLASLANTVAVIGVPMSAQVTSVTSTANTVIPQLSYDNVPGGITSTKNASPSELVRVRFQFACANCPSKPGMKLEITVSLFPKILSSVCERNPNTSPGATATEANP